MNEFIKQFKKKHILVFGDLMLDEYILGTITRMSPEAPQTPVILTKDKKRVLGGAANVAHNIVALGGHAFLLGNVGNDNNGKRFKELLKKNGVKDYSFISSERPTTTKTRVFDGKRQVARIDEEYGGPLSKKELKLLKIAIERLPSNIDVIIVSDYAKGMVSKKTITIIKKKFSGAKIIVDPKPIHKDLMHNLYLITPNLREVSLMTNIPLRRHDDIRRVIMSLTEQLDTSVLATMGREGMMLCDKNHMSIHRVAPPKVHAIDVTGAGDVATAACALAIASGASLLEAAQFANRAASISVTKLGTATVTLKEIF